MYLLLENNRAIACYTKALEFRNGKTFRRVTEQGYTEVPCRTSKQGRRPDVAYLTPELVAQFGNVPTLPQSFPLIAEIVSPTDLAEELFLKAQEYLQSGCEEVWLVFPESWLVFVMTDNQVCGFKAGDVVGTQKVLLGFSVAVDELLG
ncbi:MAG: Uma2 family endonuclease [Nostoc sp.]|uniref:Uma2 family endonuclease n=1 Tax=Nostoc sp. TaxID=1180 RepID=UPI002FF9F5B5